MATAKTIRKRILSVKNTQKITKAMKMVAAAKLRRAQQRMVEARPFANEARDLLGRLAARAGLSSHPLFQKHRMEGVVRGTSSRSPTDFSEDPAVPVRANRLELFVMTSDKGLCGGFNGNLLRRVDEFLKTRKGVYADIRITSIGKKGRDFFRSKKIDVAKAEVSFYEGFGLAAARALAEQLMQGYTNGEFDELVIVSNRFKSTISQEVTFEQLAPLGPGAVRGGGGLPEPPDFSEPSGFASGSRIDYLYEPGPEAFLAEVALLYMTSRLYLAALESQAAELSARMVAMENATNNSADMIYRLTLEMNKARQAAITKELMDIVNGAESLKT